MVDIEKQRRVKEEILASERSYVEDLTTCVDVFMKPLLAALSAGEAILSREEIQIIFNNVELITSLNHQLLLALEQEHANPTTASSIGQIFLDLAPYLKMYTIFVKHHTNASALHQRLLLDVPRYAHFMDQASLASQQRLHNRTLPDFLIMPVQRVPRYRLLLQELVKCSAREDDLALQQALDKVTAVARMVNESIQEHKDRMKVLEVQQRFGDQVRLVEPHRKFVLEGELDKLCRRGPKPYEFFLFTDALVYASPDEVGLVYKRTLPLNTMTLVEDVEGNEFAFQISAPQKSFVCIAHSEAQKLEWVSAISACIHRWREYESALAEEMALVQHRNATAAAASATATAPVWVPDRDAPACQTCEVKFTFFLRKHHCRHCGHVVCNDCSAHRFILPNLGNSKPQRVCQECYLDMRDQAMADGGIHILQGNRPAPPLLGPMHRASKKQSMMLLQHRRSSVNSSSPAAASASLSGSPAREEDDTELASCWKVLVDEHGGRKYYWNVSTDALTFTRPPRAAAAVEEECGGSGARRRTQHLSQRFGFKRQSNSPSTASASLLEEQLAAASFLSSDNPLLSSSSSTTTGPPISPIRHTLQMEEAEVLTGSGGEEDTAAAAAAPVLPSSSSLADALAHLTDRGTFGDSTRARFSSRRINALASLASKRRSVKRTQASPSSPRSFSSIRLTSLLYPSSPSPSPLHQQQQQQQDSAAHHSDDQQEQEDAPSEDACQLPEREVSSLAAATTG